MIMRITIDAFKSLQDTHQLTKYFIRDELNINCKYIRDELNLNNETNATELEEYFIETKLQRDQLYTSSKTEDKRIENFPALNEHCEDFWSVDDKEEKYSVLMEGWSQKNIVR